MPLVGGILLALGCVVMAYGIDLGASIVKFHQSEHSIWRDLDQWECSTLFQEEQHEVKKCSFQPKTICRPVEGVGCRMVKKKMCNYIDSNQVWWSEVSREKRERERVMSLIALWYNQPTSCFSFPFLYQELRALGNIENKQFLYDEFYNC